MDHHVHIRLNRDDDVERLARALAREGVALVLSGGGARCNVHIGAVRAIRERSIPIDLVAGTSAGSFIAHLIAADFTYERMCREAYNFHRARPFSDYTLPLFSLLAGDRLTRAIRGQCGDAQLEDLWIPMVAVSCNLNRSAIELHTRGSVWRALRASASIPGVFTPQIHDGQVLVDGGVVNNLPVGVARERLPGRVLAVDVGDTADISFREREFPSPWRELVRRLVPGQRDTKPPGLIEVMIRSMLITSVDHTRRMRSAADLCLRPDVRGFGLEETKRYRELIELGYRHAKQHLDAFPS